MVQRWIGFKSGSKIDNPTETLYYFAIRQCDRNDSVDYVIKASNKRGSEEAKLSLNVVDRPDKPQGPIDITLESSQGTFVYFWLLILLITKSPVTYHLLIMRKSSKYIKRDI